MHTRRVFSPFSSCACLCLLVWSSNGFSLFYAQRIRSVLCICARSSVADNETWLGGEGDLFTLKRVHFRPGRSFVRSVACSSLETDICSPLAGNQLVVGNHLITRIECMRMCYCLIVCLLGLASMMNISSRSSIIITSNSFRNQNMTIKSTRMTMSEIVTWQKRLGENKAVNPSLTLLSFSTN